VTANCIILSVHVGEQPLRLHAGFPGGTARAATRLCLKSGAMHFIANRNAFSARHFHPAKLIPGLRSALHLAHRDFKKILRCNDPTDSTKLCE
jgi:hypothetical protein